jgi:hypothetical protein
MTKPEKKMTPTHRITIAILLMYIMLALITTKTLQNSSVGSNCNNNVRNCPNSLLYVASLHEQVYHLTYDKLSSPFLQWTNVKQKERRNTCIKTDWKETKFQLQCSDNVGLNGSTAAGDVWDVHELLQLKAVNSSISISHFGQYM